MNIVIGLLEVIAIVVTLILVIWLGKRAWRPLDSLVESVGRFGTDRRLLAFVVFGPSVVYVLTALGWPIFHDRNDPGRYLLTDPWTTLIGLTVPHAWFFLLWIVSTVFGLIVAWRSGRPLVARIVALLLVTFVTLVAVLGIDYGDLINRFQAAFHRQPAATAPAEQCPKVAGRHEGDPKVTPQQSVLDAIKTAEDTERQLQKEPDNGKLVQQQIGDSKAVTYRRDALRALPAACSTAPSAHLALKIGKTRKVKLYGKTWYREVYDLSGTKNLSTWSGDNGLPGNPLHNKLIVVTPNGTTEESIVGKKTVTIDFLECGFDTQVTMTGMGVNGDADIPPSIEKTHRVAC